MLQSFRARECIHARRLLGAALSLVLVVRLLLGPGMLPAPEPGMVAVCGGTALIYIDLRSGKGPPRHVPGAPCPFYGFAAAPPQPGVPLLPPRQAVFTGHPAPAGPVRLAGAGRAGYTPRAPPPVA